MIFKARTLKNKRSVNPRYSTMKFIEFSSLWLFFAVANGTETEYYAARDVPAATSKQLSNIALRLYTKRTLNEYKSVLIGDAAELMQDMNTRKPTVFYIFGWSESPQSKSVATIVGAYLKRGDHNVVLIDWRYIASQFYPIVVLSAGRVGRTVAKAIDDMVAAGLNAATIHVIGHSMGSSIAGFIGRNVRQTLPRITGLDPAGPGFYVLVRSLNSTDADFVDIIHTDAGVYGAATNRGTVDFFPNGGIRVQPGCPILFAPFSDDAYCSHQRAWYYYAESLLIEDSFVGVLCDSYNEFKSGRCTNRTAVMGYATRRTTRGNFYLQTNGAGVSSYGRRAKGMTYIA